MAGCSRQTPPSAAAALPCASATGRAFRYTRSEGVDLLSGTGRYQALQPYRREIWIAADGSGRLLIHEDPLRFFGASDAAEWAGYAGSPDRDQSYGPGGLALVELGQVPAEPAALRAFLLGKPPDRSQGGPTPPAEVVLRESRRYLRETVAPRPLREAILAVLRAEPGLTAINFAGVTVFSTTTSQAPRIRFEIALGPDGGFLWEKRWMLDRADSIDAKPPVVIGAADYLAEGEVPTCSDVVSP